MKEKFSKASRLLMAVAAFVLVFASTKSNASAMYFAGLSRGTQGATTENSVEVTWSKPSDAVNAYYVGIGEDSTKASDAASAHTISIDANSTSYTFNGLQAGAQYYVCIKYSYTSYGKVSTYEPAVVNGSIRTLPGNITGLNQDRWWRWIHKIDIKWDEQCVDGYEYKFMDYKGKTIKKGTGNVTSPRAELDNVKNYITYKCTVRAYSTINGQKYYSKWAPTCYCMIQPSNGDKSDQVTAKIEGGKLKVSWRKQQGVTGYNVFVATEKDWKKNYKESAYKKVKSVKANTSSVTINKFKKKSFKKGTKYCVYVQAYLKVGKRTYTTGHNYTTYVQ